MKKTLFVVVSLVLCFGAFAQDVKKDKYNYSFNFCITNLNKCVIETPMDIAVNLSKDPETLYDMCSVKMGGTAMSFRVISGIVRDKVYPNLSLIEMDGVPTEKKWSLKFLGDRIVLYRLGGVRYVFSNKDLGTTLESAGAAADAAEEE